MTWTAVAVLICTLVFLFLKVKMQHEKKHDDGKFPAFAGASLVPPLSPAPDTKPAAVKGADAREFTLEQLSFCRGKGGGTSAKNCLGFTEQQILFSVNGEVYEATSHPSGEGFYGPSGPYHLFAGNDCTVALAKISIDADDVNNFNFGQLAETHKKNLAEWILRFRAKYSFCGHLIDDRLQPLDLTAFNCPPM